MSKDTWAQIVTAVITCIASNVFALWLWRRTPSNQPQPIPVRKFAKKVTEMIKWVVVHVMPWLGPCFLIVQNLYYLFERSRESGLTTKGAIAISAHVGLIVLALQQLILLALFKAAEYGFKWGIRKGMNSGKDAG